MTGIQTSSKVFSLFFGPVFASLNGLVLTFNEQQKLQNQLIPRKLRLNVVIWTTLSYKNHNPAKFLQVLHFSAQNVTKNT